MAKEIIKDYWRLQFITQRTARYDELEGARMALEGGCRWIQLRMKGAEATEIVSAGRKMRRLCDEYGAVFVLDDHVELVEATGADGVHLGLKDMPVDEAREILDKDDCSDSSKKDSGSNAKIIGGTANSASDIFLHYRRGADYIGCGPFRFTTTKKNLSPTLGLEGYRHIVEEISKSEAKALPLIAIGGINKDDVAPILSSGMNGIAVSGSVLRAQDPAKEMQGFVEEINKYRPN